MRDYVNSTALQEYTTKLVAKLKTLFPGTPTAAATVADMTDHSKTYVYVGSETGYTAGDWYYWDGTAWTSGGPFQATSIITDTTLAVAGEAADAKATGDAIAAAKTAVLNAMAPAYSTSATYAVGNYVNHNGKVYRCTTAITTAEAWTAGHWTEVPLGTDLADQVSDLKTQITQMEDIVVVSPTEPTSETNKIWVDSDANSVQVPTMEDLWSILPNVTLTNQSIASFNDGANATIKNLVIDIESGQGETGFTAVNITRTGKNLCPSTFSNGYYDISNDGVFVANTSWRASQKIKCFPNTDYYLSGSTYGLGGTNGGVLCWDKDNNYLGTATYTGGDNHFTTLNNTTWLAFYIGRLYITDNMQIELNSVTEFEEYKGTTYQITFPTEAGAVTDGTIDAVNGKLIVGANEYDIDNVPTIETLRGINSIWADTGSINSITYRADIQKYIENVLAST